MYELEACFFGGFNGPGPGEVSLSKGHVGGAPGQEYEWNGGAAVCSREGKRGEREGGREGKCTARCLQTNAGGKVEEEFYS